jgi:hypothetical protein
MPSWSPASIEEAPENLDGIYANGASDYERLLYKNSACPNVFANGDYNQHVINTRQNRKNNWVSDLNALSLAISSNYMLFSNENTPTPNGVNLGIQSVLPDAKHVLILNNAVNICTQEDMEVRCRMLFSKTNKRLLFVTQTLSYYIPVDSLNVFRDAAAISFTNNVTDDIIVALYLKMNDAVTGQPGNTLLVKQINGSWLTLADISFANFNNSGNYTASTFHKFNNLYKNIPKPLVICAQVAKVNGLLTTIYINKGQAIKGREQIYYHSFRLDKAFDELKQLDDQLRALNQQYSGTGSPAMGTGNASPQLMLQIDQVVNRMKRVYARAASEPQFREADQHFKEVYLQSRAAVQAGALKYIQDRYRLLYHNSQFSTLIAETGLPSDLYAGSCRSSEQSDVIADVLMFTSLLLAPTGLDFIPDALSVAYFASQDNTLEFLQASASLVLPSNIKALKKAANSVKTAFDEVHLGNVLTWANGVVKGIQQDNNLMSAVFNIDLDNTDVSFINKINANPTALKELMHLPEQKGTLYSNVSRKLNESKRREFVQKAIDEPGWRQKVIDDPDEVLKWAGLVETIRGVKKTDFINSVSAFATNATLTEQAWTYFKNENWQLLEQFFNTHSLNSGWPPNNGFLNILNSENSNQLVGKVFDRFQGQQILNGSFASPVIGQEGVNELVFTYDSRALATDIQPNSYYIKFKFKSILPSTLEFTYGEAIPWFNRTGFGEQVKSTIRFDDLVEGLHYEILERLKYVNGQWVSSL